MEWKLGTIGRVGNYSVLCGDLLKKGSFRNMYGGSCDV